MKFDFIKRRIWWYILSALMILPGLISIAVQGFNLGIDFTGGTLLDLKFNRPVSVAEVREVLKDYDLEGSTIQLAFVTTGDTSPNVFIRSRILDESERRDVLRGLEQKVGPFDILRIEKVGATVGDELTRQGLLSFLAASALMVAYITYRFEFNFAAAAILSLIHDVLIVLGVFSFLRLEVDTSFIAALLTIIGYSINDRIVIFDRIRENLKLHKKSDSYAEMVNRSIWQAMTRTVYTVLNVLFATVALYFFGGETTKNFSFALLIGFSICVYASVCNACPLWVDLKEYTLRRKLALRAEKR